MVVKERSLRTEPWDMQTYRDQRRTRKRPEMKQGGNPEDRWQSGEVPKAK